MKEPEGLLKKPKWFLSFILQKTLISLKVLNFTFQQQVCINMSEES